jgi:hypothetical protein
MSFPKPAAAAMPKPRTIGANAEAVPAAQTLVAKRSPPTENPLHTTLAARIFVAELHPAAPASVRAANPLRSIGRTRAEALRAGDYTATAIPFVTTSERWLFDKDEQSQTWLAIWLAETDLPHTVREKAHNDLAYNESAVAALCCVYAHLDAEEAKP